MAKNYKILAEAEKHDILVTFHEATERDHYCFELNLQRYQAMLPGLPEGEFKKKIAGEIEVLKSRLLEVDAILAATIPTLPPADKIADAKARLEAKATKAR